MQINLVAPINTTGYGYHGSNLLRYLHELGHDVTFFPIGAVQLRGRDLDRVRSALDACHIEKRGRKWSTTAPTIRLWHEWQMDMWPFSTGRMYGYPVFEMDRLPDHSVWQLNNLDGIIAPTHWAKSSLHASGVTSPIHIVNHGVDMAVFAPAPPRGGAVTQFQPFKFLFVGKWEKRKGAEETVKAFMQTFGPDEPVRLELLAFNPFLPPEEWADIIAKHNVPNRIVFRPPVTDSNSVAYEMQAADCMVAPSRSEGWGLPILEAMACNRPVITQAVTGMTEYVTAENAYLMDPGKQVAAEDGRWFHGEGLWHEITVEEISRVMRRVYEEAKVERPGNPIGVETARKFSWHSAVENLVKAISK